MAEWIDVGKKPEAKTARNIRKLAIPTDGPLSFDEQVEITIMEAVSLVGRVGFLQRCQQVQEQLAALDSRKGKAGTEPLDRRGVEIATAHLIVRENKNPIV